MDQVDDLTKQRLREWQLRRLEIKDRMANEPERTWELTQVLDAMEDEHAQILGEASHAPQPDGLAIQLSATAATAEDLRRLLQLALHELDGLLARDDGSSQASPRAQGGQMSGSLGRYTFELDRHAPLPEPYAP